MRDLPIFVVCSDMIPLRDDWRVEYTSSLVVSPSMMLMSYDVQLYGYTTLFNEAALRI